MNTRSSLISIFRIQILLIAISLLTGCMTKQSIIRAADDFYPISSQDSQRSKYQIGLVVNTGLNSEVAHAATVNGGLTYDFEFKVGQDIQRTLPTYLNSFVDTVRIKSISEGSAFDFILDPKITSSLFVIAKPSAAPLYELSLTLDIPVMKKGMVIDRFLVRNTSQVDIDAFKNTDETRNPVMRKRYEEQITTLYNELEVFLKKLLSPM